MSLLTDYWYAAGLFLIAGFFFWWYTLSDFNRWVYWRQMEEFIVEVIPDVLVIVFIVLPWYHTRRFVRLIRLKIRHIRRKGY